MGRNTNKFSSKKFIVTTYSVLKTEVKCADCWIFVPAGGRSASSIPARHSLQKICLTETEENFNNEQVFTNAKREKNKKLKYLKNNTVGGSSWNELIQVQVERLQRC